MRLFPRRHTPESVAAELIEGLENGTITLGLPPLDVNDAIAEALTLAAEVKGAMTRYAPEHARPELPTAESLASAEKSRPGAVHEFLGTLKEAHAVLMKLETARAKLLATVNDLATESRSFAN